MAGIYITLTVKVTASKLSHLDVMQLPASQGTVTHSIPPSSIALVSFREQQQLLQHEKRKESESAFMSRHYQSEPAGDVLARVWNGDKPTLARWACKLYYHAAEQCDMHLDVSYAYIVL